MENAAMAQQRLSVILRVLSGDLNVTQAAELLGISRKSYYQWQDRALRAMRDALDDRPTGRPQQPVDVEKQGLRTQVQNLSDRLELAQKTIEAKNILADFEARQKSLSSDPVATGKKKHRSENR
jgi:transposase-like protein